MSNPQQTIAGRQLPIWLRTFVRTREAGLVLAALVIGVAAGGLVALVGSTVQAMHELLFALPHGQRLSAAAHLIGWRTLLVPVLGGLALTALSRYARRLSGRLADAIEANALFGGRLSLTGSLLVTVQTVVSCGTGGSVGLEAGYAQISAAIASRLGLALATRRGDLRLLVACGAAGAIAAAFGAPLAGAFYGFEVVLGTYTVSALAPVAASALVASQVAHSFDEGHFLIRPGSLATLGAGDLGHVVAIGVLCGFAGILLMVAVAGSETLFRRLKVPAPWRMPVGGLVVGGMGLLTPQVLGAGHGAMSIDLVASLAPLTILGIIALKGAASAVSLGSGFRGGLFYASLLIGALVGRLYHDVGFVLYPDLAFDPDVAALTGMAALGTGVIGAPVTMTALALETTGNFPITIAALIGAVVSSLIVRELFGYSFATWRFHLRGEAIRGPHDVGWMRDLSVKSLMQANVRTAAHDLTLREARLAFPLGSAKQLAVVDGAGRYAGLVMLDDLHTAPLDRGGDPVSSLSRFADRVLLPWMTVREALDLFEKGEADALVVVDHEATRRVVGTMTEAHALRRYGRALERQQPDNVLR
ncbi:chloride channel protein [Lichenibacterium dinghuense]|uniref:chloride channel protein n=1 Tax=Lichenibacterium dinghuense TaxID=2895977 RepID=UPI001F3801C7|nr:chloride channel protein [Lichenibacterium sp. 6Y81]